MDGLVCNKSSLRILDLKSQFLVKLGVPCLACDFYVTENGKIVRESDEANPSKVYKFHPRLLGGKGGFGSMLRALGAQIEKTTNREACRDLSGRRMRDVNNEKKLKEWIEKAPEREQKKREKEEGKKKKKNTESKYFFDSTVYDEQKEKIRQDFEDAIKQAMKRPATKEVKKDIDPSKAKDWFGFDLDSSDDGSDIESPAKKPRLEVGTKNENVDKENCSSDESTDVIIQNEAPSLVEKSLGDEVTNGNSQEEK